MEKTPRLLEAAKEFNIGKDTLVEFLTDQGFQISSNPGMKLTSQMYQALEKEFARDRLAKAISLDTSTAFAIDKINRCMSSQETKLDLSDLFLIKLPEQIYHCGHITELNLSGNSLKQIPNLSVLRNLEIIRANSNHINDISGLMGNENLRELYLRNNSIIDISTLSNLRLHKLDLSQNKKLDHSQLYSLSSLEELNISNTRLNSLIHILTLVNLKTLEARSNQIKDITDLSTLYKLETLFLDSNQIRDAEPLKSLRTLITLSLNNNLITDVSSFSGFTTLANLRLRGNKIISLESFENLVLNNKDIKIDVGYNPIADLNLFNNSDLNHAELIREFFNRKHRQSKIHQLSLKYIQLLVLGNGEAGKTSLLNAIRKAYLQNENAEDSEIEKLPDGSTHGSVHVYWKLKLKESDEVLLLIKDFGGQDYYHNFHPIYYNSRALYWIVNSTLVNDLDKVENGNFQNSYWIEYVKHSLRFHHQNELEKIQIDAWEITTKIDLHENHSGSVSANKHFSIAVVPESELEVHTEYTKKLYHSLIQTLYFQLIQHIESISLKENIYDVSLHFFEFLRTSDISKQSFQELSKLEFLNLLVDSKLHSREVIFENSETILNELRHLGICLYFPNNKTLHDRIFLFPEKMSKYVFEEVLALEIKEKNGILDFKEEKEGVRSLLENFEIIFQDGESGNWIVPQYLPTKHSEEDLIKIASDGLASEIKISFHNFMPQGIMTRMICHFGQNPNKKWYWKNGIFFTYTFRDQNLKAIVTSEFTEPFSITIKTANNDGLSFLFSKIILSYCNIDLNVLSELDEDKLDELELIKQIDFDMSISLNGKPSIPIRTFKRYILQQKLTFEFDSQLIKIYDYTPFLKLLIDSKYFENMITPKKIFISYSHADLGILQHLSSHIKLMERAGLVSSWHDGLVDIGSDWNEEIETNLITADIVILLLSNDFFASDYIWKKELEIINARLKNNSVTIVPILCRHCMWTLYDPFIKDENNGHLGLRIGKFQGLPTKQGYLHPIMSDAFKYPDEAYSQIAGKLHELLTT